ncbi:MAG TPA: hypothetical protein VGD67_21215 [Pseudonocardiaceae bacterium]
MLLNVGHLNQTFALTGHDDASIHAPMPDIEGNADSEMPTHADHPFAMAIHPIEPAY